MGALTRARRFQLPRTRFLFPDSTYWDGGTNSPAETIIFYFAPDTTTEDGDDTALYRQVNDQSPAVVARSLSPMPGRPYFQYQELVESEGAPPTTGRITQSRRGAVGQQSGSGVTGYLKRYEYDACAATSPPPYFPTTGYFGRDRQYEVDPVEFDVDPLFQAITAGE